MSQFRICIIVLISLLLLSCKTTETVIDHTEEKAQTISKDSILSVFGSISDNIELINDIQQKRGEIIIKNDTILFNIILNEKSVLNKINKIDSITYVNSNIIRDTIYINNQYKENTSQENSFFKNLGKRTFLFMLFIIVILTSYILYNKRKKG